MKLKPPVAQSDLKARELELAGLGTAGPVAPHRMPPL